MEQQRPRGRDRKVTGTAKDIRKTGQALGTGPVGSSSGNAGRPGGGSSGSGMSGGSRGSGNRGGGMNPLILVIIAVLLLGGGGSGLAGLLGGGSSSQQNTSATYGTGHSAYSSNNSSGGFGSASTTQATPTAQATPAAQSTQAAQNTQNTQNSTQQSGTVTAQDFQSYINSLFGGDPSTYTSEAGSVGAVTAETGGTSATGSNAASLTIDETASTGARAKRTQILGGGRDTVTIMVYMCGTDLESRSGMATSDLQEMASANLGNLNVIVYTGGCARWRNNIVSNSVNQIYQVKNGGITCLMENAGTGAMTDPSTLASFIKWCGTNFPANRNELIFWDHGGGSVSGYGYDEKNQRAGSMSLAGINKALKAAGVTFDFIGFDACLMATTENALMLNSYGDYMIGSEETEPGVGWYYTDWLTNLAKNTSMPTTEIGRQIADDFVKVCAKRCPGQQTTLSVIDLAEFAYAVPEKLTAFSKSISTMIADNNYRQVSNARNRTREFAASTRIDQIDLIDLCDNLGNTEGRNLADALRSAIKYNTCNNISKASGVSIYFPYQSTSKVDSAVNTYSAIGMDESYAQCIKEFASLEAAGQFSAGGTSSPLGSLLGGAYGGYSSGSSSSYEADALSALLGAFFGGDVSSVSGLSGSNIGFFSGRSLTDDQMAKYISDNHIDTSQFVWQQFDDGTYRMDISEDQWKLIAGLDLSMYYDNGDGYLDLGLDNIYNFDSENRLVANTDKIWLSVNGQVAAYYHENTEDDGENYIISGRIPCLLNDVRSELIVVFDNDHPLGTVVGARTVYSNGETDTVSKSLTELSNGDVVQLIADEYTYDGNFHAAYPIGDPITVSGELEIGNLEFTDLGDVQITYKIRDIYNQEYWTPIVGEN